MRKMLADFCDWLARKHLRRAKFWARVSDWIEGEG